MIPMTLGCAIIIFETVLFVTSEIIAIHPGIAFCQEKDPAGTDGLAIKLFTDGLSNRGSLSIISSIRGYV